MKHALVIGGSGMLAKVSLWLADNDYVVSVIGRNERRLSDLAAASPHIESIAVDYDNKTLFKAKIQHSIAAYGAYDIVVAWIHNGHKQIIDIVSGAIQIVSEQKWSLFHVLGSRANLAEISQEMDRVAQCDYHQIQLGFVIENDCSRWLTHDEISSGVIAGIQANRKSYLVGTLTPWNKRPQ